MHIIVLTTSFSLFFFSPLFLALLGVGRVKTCGFKLEHPGYLLQIIFTAHRERSEGKKRKR